MPNHVTTRCAVFGPASETKRFADRAFIKKEQRTDFDFNAFIPMPEILSDTLSGSVSHEGAILLSLTKGRSPPQSRMSSSSRDEIYPNRLARMREELGLPQAPLAEVAQAWLDKNPDYRSEGEKRLRAFDETGFADWYDWSIANWHTKWNAYDFHLVQLSPLEFTFNTAWDFPAPVFRKIAEQFPALSFRCSCYDEGGNFAGDGFFNPRDGQKEFGICDATDELYERVYGHPPDLD
ncbi:MAG: hypothetical protein ACRD19_02150 [Terriglobia bacterium]